jgi:hypothetical protein
MGGPEVLFIAGAIIAVSAMCTFWPILAFLDMRMVSPTPTHGKIYETVPFPGTYHV